MTPRINIINPKPIIGNGICDVAYIVTRVNGTWIKIKIKKTLLQSHYRLMKAKGLEMEYNN